MKSFDIDLLDTRALNKTSWSRDGSKLLTGSSDGNLKLYGLHKNVSVQERDYFKLF